MPRSPASETSQPEIIALKALGFLAADENRFERFIALTGLTPAEIRQRAGEPAFLSGVMQHLAQDESLLLAFAAQEGLSPQDVVRSGRRLAGDGAP